MAKQHALFDCEWERSEQDRENMAREWEKIKFLNDQLLANIMTLQNTRGPPPSSERPTDAEATSGEQS